MLSVKVDRNPILSIRDSVDRGPTIYNRRAYLNSPLKTKCMFMGSVKNRKTM